MQKLEVKGSRLSFSFSSDFVILQPARITLFGKVCKRYKKTKKIIFRQNLEQKLHNNGFQNQNSSSPRNSATVSGSLNQYIKLRQFSFSSQPVMVTPGKAQETPRQRDIVYFDRQRPHQNPDYSKAKDQDLRTARNIAKT